MTKEEYNAQDFGEAVEQYPGMPGIYIQRFDEGSPDHKEYGGAIISNYRSGASKKGFEEDITNYGQGVDGARFYNNQPLNTEAANNLPRMFQQATAQGRANAGYERQLTELNAIRQWQQQPEAWEEDGNMMRKAPMPDWAADRMRTPRRGESSYDYQARLAAEELPARQAAQEQAEAQAEREKQMIAMYPQMMEHYRKAAQDSQAAEKNFIENGYRAIKNAPNDLLAGAIIGLAQGLSARPLEVQSILQQIIARDESKYGAIDWGNQETIQGIIDELSAAAAARFQ
jgi:hypothetical protein